jgi:hypothetical protein
LHSISSVLPVCQGRVHKHDISAALGALEFSSLGAAALDPPIATGTAEEIAGGGARGADDVNFGETAGGAGADFEAFVAPTGAVIGTRREGVGDLVKEGVADFFYCVEEREGFGEGDSAMSVIAAAEAATGMIELECPIEQAVLFDEVAGEMGGFVEIHHVFSRGGVRTG